MKNNGAVGSECAWDPGGLSKCWNREELCEGSVINNRGQDKEMNGRTEFYNEVKWVVVLSVTRTLGSHKTFTSYGDVITVPAFGFWSLEDKAVLPGSTLKLYGEKTAKLFLSAEKRIIEEAADCHEANSQDWENVLMTFIL
ncbi:hypothetical protein Bca4012_018919 [Brassica carinata]